MIYLLIIKELTKSMTYHKFNLNKESKLKKYEKGIKKMVRA